MRLKLISCEVLFRELCALVARSPHQVDVEFLPKGLHDLGGKKMAGRLQAVIDEVDAASYDAILLGYALCGNGIVGLQAQKVPLVVPRGHDCITLFLGSRKRYLEYFDANPGTYFKTSGWIERGKSNSPQLGAGVSLDELVAKYGEDDGRYIFEQLTQQYRQIAFIEMGVEPDARFEEAARAQAEALQWSFDKLQGELALLRRFINGDWESDDFLVVPPGSRIEPTYDDRIVKVEEVTGP
jgi:hypothetical protein